MDTILNYQDALLRDLVNHWVVFESDVITPSAGVTLRERRIVGFLYVDHERGFLLRVESEVCERPVGSVAHAQDLSALAWDLPYPQVSKLAMRKCTPAECQTLGLPPRPYALWRHFQGHWEDCRNRTSLDQFRVLGHPDEVWAWVRVGKQLRGDRLLVRLEEQSFEGVYECVVVAPPKKVSGISVGDRLVVVQFGTKNEAGLHCVWLLEKPPRAGFRACYEEEMPDA